MILRAWYLTACLYDRLDVLLARLRGEVRP